MPGNKTLLIFAFLAFSTGVAMKCLEIVYGDYLGSTIIGFLSVIALSALMLAFYFMYLR